jgi:hypothetical protein
VPLLLDPTFIDGVTWDSPWLSSSPGASDADIALLHRLLARIPTHWSLTIKRHILLGVPQHVVGQELGIAQASVCARIKVGLRRMLLVARHLPDLLPEEVEADLLQAAVRPALARMASLYWREHRTAACGVPQPTAFHALFSKSHGLVYKNLPGTAGKIVEGVKIIRTWPSARPIAKSDTLVSGSNPRTPA